jgi:hypothetical protein
MALPIWTQDALRSDQRPFKGLFWRCVEAQHVVSTLALVDTLEEQRLLEDILEETKPPAPPECEGLHYLYMTPFRYGLYPHGSRFRKAGKTPGVFYASSAPHTAVIEMAFHILLFYADSPATPFPAKPNEYTLFDAPVRAKSAINLSSPPFDKASAQWMDLNDYSDCQALEGMARSEGVDLILYQSVRDPERRLNGALLDCRGFASKRPKVHQSWKLWFNAAGAHAIQEFGEARFSIAPEAFARDKRIARMKWER